MPQVSRALVDVPRWSIWRHETSSELVGGNPGQAICNNAARPKLAGQMCIFVDQPLNH